LWDYLNEPTQQSLVKPSQTNQPRLGTRHLASPKPLTFNTKPETTLLECVGYDMWIGDANHLVYQWIQQFPFSMCLWLKNLGWKFVVLGKKAIYFLSISRIKSIFWLSYTRLHIKFWQIWRDILKIAYSCLISLLHLLGVSRHKKVNN